MLKWFWIFKRRQHLKNFRHNLNEFKAKYNEYPEIWADIGIVLPVFVAGIAQSINFDAFSIMAPTDMPLSKRMMIVYALEHEVKREIDETSDAQMYCLRLAVLYYGFHYLQFLAEDQPDIMPAKTNALINEYHDFIMRVARDGEDKLELLNEQENAKDAPVH